jgi:SAM-dependent methyltransferase
MGKEWFERWFGEEYKALYPHRDEAQAQVQVEVLIRACAAQPSWKILDVGCGAGRHLRGFHAGGFRQACGIDLSMVLLRDAAGLPVTRADMRRLPFADGTFELLGCFFTSFGYFATREEDLSVLGEFCRVVKRGAFVFLDLHNPERVLRDLVPRDTHAMEGGVVEVERFRQGDQVVKRILIRDAGGGEEAHEERVRLFPLADLTAVLEDLGLSLLRVLGDESGAEFSPETSPRMGLLLRRS